MEELLEAGVHFGHQVRRGNPKMRQYIYGARDGVHIIDLAFSESLLKEAAQAVFEMGKNGKVMLLVGTKKQAREIIESLAKEVDTPYLTSRWVGGMLTNFDEIKKNLNKLNELKELRAKGELSKYTKKEQLLISRKLEKYDVELGGISSLDKVPDAMFIVDTPAEMTAVKEGARMGIKLIGFSDTNSDPNLMDFPIPANDDGIKSIKIIAETVIRAYGEGKEAAGVVITGKAKEEKKPTKKEEIEEKVSDDVIEETAVIEEEIEKEVLSEFSRKEGQA